MFNKILLAADGSAHSLRAAEKAITIAKYNEDTVVTVLYVVDGSTSKTDVLRQLDIDGISQKRQQKMKSTEEKAIQAGIQYEIKIVRGEPSPTIVKYAEDHQMDIIIIGSRGLNGLQEMVLGSVSYKVANRAKCPVMIVK